jgi:hypothetical protein
LFNGTDHWDAATDHLVGAAEVHARFEEHVEVKLLRVTRQHGLWRCNKVDTARKFAGYLSLANIPPTRPAAMMTTSGRVVDR